MFDTDPPLWQCLGGSHRGLRRGRVDMTGGLAVCGVLLLRLLCRSRCVAWELEDVMVLRHVGMTRSRRRVRVVMASFAVTVFGMIV